MSKIVTSSWRTTLPAGCEPIGISRGTPRGRSGYRRYLKLQPGSWFSSTSIEEFTRRYDEEILGPLDPKLVVEDLLELAAERTRALVLGAARAKPQLVPSCTGLDLAVGEAPARGAGARARARGLLLELSEAAPRRAPEFRADRLTMEDRMVHDPRIQKLLDSQKAGERERLRQIEIDAADVSIRPSMMIGLQTSSVGRGK
jgi:hypothetical protein